MTLRVLLSCAAGALLLGIAAQPVHAQSEWPPDDDPTYTIPPQHDYPPDPQQPAYPQQPGYGGQQYSYAQPDPNQPFESQPGYAQQPGYSAQPQYAVQPLSADRLTQIVAPIALYPDALVAQILTAATYPAQIAAADQWLRGMQGVPADQIAAAANAQTAWDPSIKALTAFPDVLAMLAQNLQWSSELGNAYYNQPQDVLATVQMLRDRAQQAGNLQPTPQEQVTNNQGYIAIAPANPQIVYVPTYNPWAIYGAPIAPYPGFSFAGEFGSFIGTGIRFGVGFVMDPWLNFTFGLASWGLDWLGDAILFNHEFCWTHSYEMHDWGYRYGGPRWRGGDYGYGRGGGYDRGGYGGGRQWARLGDYNHQAIDVHGGDGNGRRGRFPDMRPGNGGLRGGQYSHAYGGQSAYNRMPAAGGRPMPYSGAHGFMGNGTTRPVYGGSTYGAPRPGSGGYPGYGGDRAYSHVPARPGGGWPQSGAVRAGGGFAYGGSPYQGNRGTYSRMPSAPSYGGGSHSLFGGGHAPSYGGGNRSFNSDGSHGFFGGGSSHSFGGGGHSFGDGGGHSFGGGGHSFGGGGGHSFGGGGGHSFGGGGHSSGGGYSGGGGHRR